MSSADNPFSLVEHNLLIAQIGLEMGILTERVVKNAFTLWVCDRTERLEDLLITMKAIRPEQKSELIEALKEWQSKQAQSDLHSGSVSDVKSLDSVLEFLEDSDINHSLTALQSQFTSSSSAQAEVRREFHTADPATAPIAPDRFVRKHILSSQGGMGEVWIATDQELNREVIVKYIKDDRTKDAQHRGMFQLEGEVTGFLEHPNIPPVYGLNSDSQSRPYYAMRYYQGKKFTKAIAEYHVLGSSSPGARREAFRDLLQSFISACLAVEYAHTRGIIHCDIKPDNIILGDFGETIVLDWGLVVVTEPTGNPQIDLISGSGISRPAFSPSKVAEEGLHQKQGGSRNYVGGTLAYMAPEQLLATETGEVDQVTKASDIYCLGSTLYHLCTGRAPLVPIRKKDENKDAYLERVKNARFPRPRSLRTELSPRLEAVIYKAMALNPADRYPSAQALAEEIKHWLADEPVAAYPEGAALRLGRWVRRNREKVSVGFGIFFVCLLAGASLVWWERQKTYQNFLKAKEIGMSLVSLMRDSEAVYASMDGMTAKRKEVFRTTANAFKSFLKDLPDDPELLRTYASVCKFLANIERIDNQIKLSMGHYDESIRALRKLQMISPDRRLEIQNDLCDALRETASCLTFLGRSQESDEKLAQAIQIANTMISENPEDTFCKRLKAMALLWLACSQQDSGSFEEGEKTARESASIFSEIVKDAEGDGTNKPGAAVSYDLMFLGVSMNQVAVSMRSLNRLTDAEKKHEEALDQLRPLTTNLKQSRFLTYIGTTRQDIVSHVTNCLTERLQTWIELNRPPETIEGQFKMLVKQWRTLVRQNPDYPSYKDGLANMLWRYGQWKIKQRPDEARILLEEANQIFKNLIKNHPDVAFYKDELSACESSISEIDNQAK